MSLTLAPHKPSDSRCLLSSCKGSQRLMSICGGGLGLGLHPRAPPGRCSEYGRH